MLGMLFENGMTCGIVGKRGMSGAVAGSGAGNINKVSFDSAKIDEKTLKQLKKYNLDKKYQQELKNGFAARRQGTNGVIRLTDNEIIKKNGYTYMYKLKVTKAGDHLRVCGRIDENGNLVFDYITKGN